MLRRIRSSTRIHLLRVLTLGYTEMDESPLLAMQPMLMEEPLQRVVRWHWMMLTLLRWL